MNITQFVDLVQTLVIIFLLVRYVQLKNLVKVNADNLLKTSELMLKHSKLTDRITTALSKFVELTKK